MTARWTLPLRLRSDAAHQYDELGYLLLGSLMPPAAVERARAELDRMLFQLNPEIRPDEIYSAHQQERWLLELAVSDDLLDAVEQVIGSDIVLWSTHLICKPPRTGRAIPWHQDGTYWNVVGRMVSVWLALDDVDRENGTMYVLPRWHKQVFGRRPTGDEFFDEEIQPDALPKNIEQQQVEYRFKAGEAGMHHVLIPHSSPPNLSSTRWRRVLVIRYMSADGEMGAKQYPDYRTNELFDRQYILVRGRDVKCRGLIGVDEFLSALSVSQTDRV